MNKIRKFFLKYWIFILLTTLATILAGFYFKNKTLPPQKSEKLLSLASPEINFYPIPISPNILKLEENFPSFDKKVEVYQVVSSSFSDQQAISTAKNLGFLTPPLVSRDQQGDTIYDWDTNEKSLSINLRWGVINYGVNPSAYQNITPGTFPSFSQAENIAKEFLENNRFLPPEGITLKTKDIFYIRSSEYESEKVSSSQEANLIQVDFEYEINNKKLIKLYVTISIDFTGQVAEFSYQSTFKEIKLLDFYPLKTKEEIMQILKTKKEISYLRIPNYYAAVVEESKNITNLTFDNIELVYLKYDPLQSYLQPVFLITGKAILKDGREAEVGLYLPAIKEEYLLK